MVQVRREQDSKVVSVVKTFLEWGLEPKLPFMAHQEQEPLNHLEDSCMVKHQEVVHSLVQHLPLVEVPSQVDLDKLVKWEVLVLEELSLVFNQRLEVEALS